MDNHHLYGQYTYIVHYSILLRADRSLTITEKKIKALAE